MHEFLFAADLGLGPVGIFVTLISGLGFIAMFGIASAKGDYQGLIKTTLKNDEDKRNSQK